jgi:hypothetical protein
MFGGFWKEILQVNDPRVEGLADILSVITHANDETVSDQALEFVLSL